MGRGGGSEGSRKNWAELYGCIKQVSNDQSLQWQSLENLGLFLCLRETENWNSSSKTLFYKGRERERRHKTETEAKPISRNDFLRRTRTHPRSTRPSGTQSWTSLKVRCGRWNLLVGRYGPAVRR